jgi:hypothetical protein
MASATTVISKVKPPAPVSSEGAAPPQGSGPPLLSFSDSGGPCECRNLLSAFLIAEDIEAVDGALPSVCDGCVAVLMRRWKTDGCL